MQNIRVMMVDDEPLIRKIVKLEMNSRESVVECLTSDVASTEMRRVEMVDTFENGPSMMAALDSIEPPDYMLVDMEVQGEPTAGLTITRRLHQVYPQVKIIIFSGRFDSPLVSEMRITSTASSRDEYTRRMNEIGQVVMEALRLGASAFVSKNAAGGFSVENILRAIACLERGEQFYFNYPVMLTLKDAAERYFDRIAQTDFSVELTPIESQLLLLEAAGYTAGEISDQLGETDKAIQERQKELSRRLGIVNKSGARVAKAISLGLIDTSQVKFLRRL